MQSIVEEDMYRPFSSVKWTARISFSSWEMVEYMVDKRDRVSV